MDGEGHVSLHLAQGDSFVSHARFHQPHVPLICFADSEAGTESSLASCVFII